ncbi:uncharacterized protein B0T15DRAFT_527719 [Chaetomium strumarium]|uniref:Uncharacterized protein n=1 Tax=Chaetomium strumarium TaxID=1170767 RepID=A0AAJ0GV27_9PEZI|nr:hypothetical protein B0T15DRAFT_527719 [Chaetomium strumarium]
MRGLLAAGLLVLQVPALVDGLPNPLQVDRDSASASASTQTSLSSGPSTQIKTPALALPNDELVTGESTTLERELADLHVLRVQLAELEKEVSSRETWLAQATGLTPHRPPPSIADCDSLRCIVQALRCKAAHAASALLNTASSDTNHANITHHPSRNTTTLVEIPVPPWRTNGTRTAPPGSLTSAPIPAVVEDGVVGGSDDPPLALLLLLVGLAGLACLGTQLALSCCRVGRQGLAGALPPPVTVTRRGPGWWRAVWEQRLVDGASLWRRSGQRGGVQVRLGEEEGYGNGEGYEYRDEKGPCYLDEKTAHAHALYEAGGDEEEERDGERDMESECASEAEEEEEELTLGEELASFRAALDLVEGIVAAEEQRARERESDALR